MCQSEGHFTTRLQALSLIGAFISAAAVVGPAGEATKSATPCPGTGAAGAPVGGGVDNHRLRACLAQQRVVHGRIRSGGCTLNFFA